MGLDVGGTHTDAVLVRADNGACLAWTKTVTREGDALPGIVEALGRLLRGVAPARVRRLCVSSTIGLNALLSHTTEPVGLLALPGPGIDPRLFWRGPAFRSDSGEKDDPLFQILDAAQDHRGRIVAQPEPADVDRACRILADHAVRGVGVVSKFSPKNPELERRVAAMAHRTLGSEIPVFLGSEVSGSLNFPRRIHTTWCNAALSRTGRAFLHSLEEAAASFGLTCPIFILKADAGAFAAKEAASDPASTLGSGPAASLLGVWALAGNMPPPLSGDMLMIDMGGTSTDLALLADGFPLLARQGLEVDGRPTLIRSLWTHSLALGGDSCLRIVDGRLSIGPDRSGPPLCLSDPAGLSARPPTFTDALNVLGLADIGDRDVSHAALKKLAAVPDSPAPDAENLCRLFLQKALARVQTAAEALLGDVNAQPVYTIRELLVQKTIAPVCAVCIGGPARALAQSMEEALGLPVHVPAESAFANAVGAALARPTQAAELYADTLLGRMTIPTLGLEKTIGKGYALPEALTDLRAALGETPETALPEAEHPGEAAVQNDIQIVFAESFAMIDDQGRKGRSVRVRAQRAAGLLAAPAEGEQ